MQSSQHLLETATAERKFLAYKLLARLTLVPHSPYMQQRKRVFIYFNPNKQNF